jgi:hypothetical protein
MYMNPDAKVEDNRSTAWSFTIVSVLGIVVLVLLDLDRLPFVVAVEQKVVLSAVMGCLFLIFLVIGIRSFLSIRQLEAAAQEENSLEKEITEWFLKEHAADMRDFSTEAVNPESPEELYYPRYERMSELILAQYPGISEDFKDHVIEELYAAVFPE